MFLTRIGENSKIVVNGDPTQIDLPNKNMSGLVRSKELLGHLNEISVVDFDLTKPDIFLFGKSICVGSP